MKQRYRNHRSTRSRDAPRLAASIFEEDTPFFQPWKQPLPDCETKAEVRDGMERAENAKGGGVVLVAIDRQPRCIHKEAWGLDLLE